MGQAFLALRHAPDGISPVVIKLVRPSVESGAQNSAGILVQKEAVALGRLNERIPPCPFVVRLVDTGATHLNGANRPPTPWLAVEYVHGGVEGTTLEDRVKGSDRAHRRRVRPSRAPRTCSSAWRRGFVNAIHGVGVVHRDLTPGNILCCCGFGEAEILKIPDFGIARPQGLAVRPSVASPSERRATPRPSSVCRIPPEPGNLHGHFSRWHASCTSPSRVKRYSGVRHAAQEHAGDFATPNGARYSTGKLWCPSCASAPTRAARSTPPLSEPLCLDPKQPACKEARLSLQRGVSALADRDRPFLGPVQPLLDQ